ncbi:T9SS type A sorting domain-containing protein [Flavicella sediminum]|uniref:T9SS type A sorting domain-containing protein n=1 Tax=Flavicella sediminum TaxID=2585141 RepID=UPI00140E50D5|nr:T9SS type A sorting domain-containing protein [Flavicella sediminum]
MKKKLLFTIAFFGSLFITSAQLKTSVTVDVSNTSTAQNFTVGKEATDDLNDVSNFVTLLTGTGANTSENNSFFGILAGAEASDATGTFQFSVKADAGTANANITINAEKRGGNIATYSISATTGGTTVTDAVAPSAGATKAISSHALTFLNVPLTTSDNTITLALTELLKGDVPDAGNRPTFRIASIAIQVEEPASIDQISTEKNSLYPNPVTSAFQLSSNETIESVQIFGINGSLLKTFKAAASYDISDLASGVYFVSSNSDNGTKTVKIVKK